jgi:hypothetical protein
MFQFWFLIEGCMYLQYVHVHFVTVRVNSKCWHVGGWESSGSAG